MAYVVGRDERDAARRGERGEPAIEPLLGGIEMASEVDIKIAAAEDRAEPVAQRARIVAASERERKRTAGAAGQTDQSRAVAFEIVQRDAALSLGGIFWRAPLLDFDGVQRPHLRSGDHPAQIAVALAVGHQHVEPLIVRIAGSRRAGRRQIERQFRADDRAYPGALGAMVKARRAVQSVAIAHRQRRVAEFRGAFDQVFGQRRSFEKTERAARPQLYIFHH